ncbi:peptidase S16, lon-like protein [Moraxella macacae 0408225]|uniref:endopeptidase La n=1 Tax=Moraxella macacae 0408225 TaxID=1230338 RepID=L2F6L2_9GAMM|nr:ATP-binding protein [Moraxella macacae]ELA08436.1 peptidase S16, lon-like protein [Moraxella macacae 0408225]
MTDKTTETSVINIQKINKQKINKQKSTQTNNNRKNLVKTILTNHLQPLDFQQLKRHSDPVHLPKDSEQAKKLFAKQSNAAIFSTEHFNVEHFSAEQPRAYQAIRTALNIHANGYHIFASGENGLGKRTFIEKLLSEHAKSRQKPSDWVYVHNFADERMPVALALPTGMAQDFSNDIKQLWLSAKRLLNQRFRSEHYQAKIEAIKNQISLQEEQAFLALNEEGKQFALTLSVGKFDNKPIFMPINDDDHESGHHKTIKKPLNTLGIPKHKQSCQKNHMQKRLSLLTVALEKIEDEANQTLQNLHRSLAKRTLAPLFAPLQQKYAKLANALDYLQAVFDDMQNHVEQIVNEDDEFLPGYFSPVPARYFVNVMVCHDPNQHAPIVFEALPTCLNLLGHVEQITHMGVVSTDISLIRPGSLHRANGGYLVIDASSLLEYPYAWQGLKHALQTLQIKISNLEQMLTLTGSISLEPQAIALDVKVILLGEPDLYYDLLEFEPKFNTLFNICADFQDTIVRTPDNELVLVAKMVDMIDQYQLATFDNTALAAVLDYLSEQAEDQNELSLHNGRLLQLLLESDRLANLAKNNSINKTDQIEKPTIVTAKYVHQAINDKQYRLGYLRQLFWQELKKEQQLISTTGQAIGQINALTVINHADSEFGMPARLTASVHYRVGDGDILDIERDVDLGGAIHAKGVLIMSSYLRGLFADDYALNFNASLAFEQSYGEIDGDSATVAETCALLSALANVPIFQHLAITGSMNQFGQVQAVGGINAKIAGFFDACLINGLTGNQGVIIPKANIRQLMLRQDIIEQVKQKQFFIYAIEHVNEALQLLTGMQIDTCNKKGNYQKHTLYRQITKRLEHWTQKDHDNKQP